MLDPTSASAASSFPLCLLIQHDPTTTNPMVFFSPRSKNFPNSFSFRAFVQNVSSSRHVYCSEIHVHSTSATGDFLHPHHSLSTLVLFFLHSNYYTRVVCICLLLFTCLSYETLGALSVLLTVGSSAVPGPVFGPLIHVELHE